MSVAIQKFWNQPSLFIFHVGNKGNGQHANTQSLESRPLIHILKRDDSWIIWSLNIILPPLPDEMTSSRRQSVLLAPAKRL